jgi:hypothetical protein
VDDLVDLHIFVTRAHEEWKKGYTIGKYDEDTSIRGANRCRLVGEAVSIAIGFLEEEIGDQ